MYTTRWLKFSNAIAANASLATMLKTLFLVSLKHKYLKLIRLTDLYLGSSVKRFEQYTSTLMSRWHLY